VRHLHRAEALRRRLLAVERLVALDLPAIAAGFDEIAGIRPMTPGRLADGAEFVVGFVRQ